MTTYSPSDSWFKGPNGVKKPNMVNFAPDDGSSLYTINSSVNSSITFELINLLANWIVSNPSLGVQIAGSGKPFFTNSIAVKYTDIYGVVGDYFVHEFDNDTLALSYHSAKYDYHQDYILDYGRDVMELRSEINGNIAYQYFTNIRPNFFGGALDPRGISYSKSSYMFSGADTIQGDIYDDIIYSDEGDDLLFGMAGNDTLKGENGNDKLIGGEGNDNIYGGLGNDNLWGGDGNDYIVGDEGNDNLFGGSGDDKLFGESGSDIIYGEDGNDIIWGREGNDIIYGGLGIDSSTHSNSSNDISNKFKVKLVKNTGWVEDSIFAVENQTTKESDLITGIEYILFTDKKINVNTDIYQVFNQVDSINAPSAQIFRLYNAAFARFPDADGLRYWINDYKTQSIRSISSNFIISNEFTSKYGQNNTTSNFVDNLYLNILGRLPDESGKIYWVNQINSGRETRSLALLGFSESIENKGIFTDLTGLK